MDVDSCLILFLISDMEIRKHKRNCATSCYKSNIGSLEAHRALEFINETLTDEIDAGLALKRETIDALNEVKRILILLKR